MRPRNPLGVIVRGALAGLAGTVVLNMTMNLGIRLAEEEGKIPGRRGQPLLGTKPGGEAPTEIVVERVAERVLEEPIDEVTKRKAGRALYWGYGAAWGALYGILQSSFRLPAMQHGLVFGGFVGLVNSTIIPAARIGPSLDELPKRIAVVQMGAHLLFGLVTSFAYRRLHLARWMPEI
jgi:hypothetical protein